jgi:D-glycero-alpha-D-manno-heptose-7-phosphate kinase
MIISRAPVRLSMGGGGTDLPSYYKKFGGFLMATCIDKYVHIMVNKRFNETIRLSYSRTEIVTEASQIEHDIFREALNYLDITKQIEIVSVADIPASCGLGTSSAFSVALLNGLYAYKKQYISSEQIAKSACHIELDVLAQPIGKQDQYAAAFGGFKAYWFEKDGSVTVEDVNLNEGALRDLQNNILLFYLKSERSAGSVLKSQDSKTKDGDGETVERLHKIKQLGLYTRQVFEKGKISEFGEILHEHWLTKRGLCEKVSNSFIDEMYDLARKNGAIGGKVVGAGGGGFLLLYCPGNKSVLVSAMAKAGLEPMWFFFEKEGAKIVFQS